MPPPVPNSSQPQTGQLPSIPSVNMIAPPRADFEEGRYEQLIAQHGIDCIHEKALQCPCKSEAINALSTCKNCGGTGWIFVNGKQIRIVIQGMNYKKVEDFWSSLMNGIINISYLPEHELAYYDRITRINAKSIFSEVIDFEHSSDSSKAFGFLSYPPKVIEHVALYQSASQKLLPLEKDQYTITNNRINLVNVDLPYFDKIEAPLTATIRYSHAPTFNVIEVQRESFDKFKWDGKSEVLQDLPGKAIARRTHQLEDMMQLRNGKLFDNSYEDNCCCK